MGRRSAKSSGFSRSSESTRRPAASAPHSQRWDAQEAEKIATETTPANRRDAVIFDLGGVLIDWDPRHLYRKLFGGDDVAMEAFLAEVCTAEWNQQQDAGRSCAEAARLLRLRHPGRAELIDAYYARFDEMMAGPVAGSVDILAELHRRGTALYGLSNFSAETYPLARHRFEFIGLLRQVVISGAVKASKPDPRIYQILLDGCGIDPQRAVFVDDVTANVETARRLGLHGVLFAGAAALRQELVGLRLL
jgi:2-haloacid dehalogenase